jgi:hypothetical protein
MNLFTTLFTIFNIINISYAYTTNVNYLRSNLDDKILEKTCLGKYTGVFHSFIYYSANSSSTDYYVIRTAWLLTYPGSIRSKLISNNMTIIDGSIFKNKCGWTLVAEAKNAAVSTGNVYYKNNRDTITEDIGIEILYNTYPYLEIILMVVFIGIPLIVVAIVGCIIAN